MTLMREVVESFLRLLRAEVHEGAVLVPPDDVFEVTKVPSLVVQGPIVMEDGSRRCPARLLVKDVDEVAFTDQAHPRLYHLDFDVVATAGDGAGLLDLQEKAAQFFQSHQTLPVGELGELNLTLLAPLGGLRRVNLSNLRRTSGRCRIEDCPIYEEGTIRGKLIRMRIFEFRDGGERGAHIEDAVFAD
jgi:hypothetical protein